MYSQCNEIVFSLLLGIYENLFLTIEQNWSCVAFNVNLYVFRMETGEVSLDSKAPKAASHHLSAVSTNAQCEFKNQPVKTEKREPTERFHHSLL